MLSVPLVQTPDRNLNQLQQNLKQAIDPVLSNPLVSGLFVSANLVNGTTVINHGLNRKLQGWFLTRINGLASVYDQQDTNQNPTSTLILVSNAVVAVTIYCF